MIKSLKIKNIQSHINSVLNFSDNINIIIGSSNNGKSAILRALLWVIYNRPLGIDNLANHNIYDDRNNLIDTMSVIVENDNHTVERRRNNNINQYIVDECVFNAVKSEVPDDVYKCLRLTETNIQKQLDAPFLVSKSDYEIAKYFNTIINIDIIDKILNKAESVKRNIKSKINDDNEEIKKIENNLSRYGFLDDVEFLVDKYYEYLDKFNDISSNVNELENDINSIILLSENKNTIDNVLNMYCDFNSCYLNLKNLDDEIIELEDSINTSCKNFDLSVQNNLIDEIKNQYSYEFEIKEIQDDIENFDMLTLSIITNNKLIDENKNQLPDTCPYCGNLLNGGIK